MAKTLVSEFNFCLTCKFNVIVPYIMKVKKLKLSLCLNKYHTTL
jgi:hypothetical protein